MIIPVYNTEKYLAECLDSCLDQDIPYSDYEIICVNDGSTDGSAAILAEYAEKYENIVIITQENAGVSAARNAGMDRACGDYIWFIDSDDLIHSNMLSKLRNTAKKSDYDVISFQMYLFNDSLTENELTAIQSYTLRSNTKLCSQPTMLINKNCIGTIRWREGIEVGEDSIFLRELYLSKIHEIKVDLLGYFYRQHSQSAIHSRTKAVSMSRLYSHINGAIIMRDIYNSDNGACEANANYLMMFIVYATSMIAGNYNKETKQALRIMKENKLFPCRKPIECTKKDSFMTARKDIIGRVFNYLCLNSHTSAGFMMLRLWYMIYDIKKLTKH